jgi:hypothetical protein
LTQHYSASMRLSSPEMTNCYHLLFASEAKPL